MSEANESPKLPPIEIFYEFLRQLEQIDVPPSLRGLVDLEAFPGVVEPLTESNVAPPDASAYDDLPTESQDARKAPPNNGYTSKVRVLDRYKVVGFISSGTYGRVYKAVGVNGQVGEFAIKKCVRHISIHGMAFLIRYMQVQTRQRRRDDSIHRHLTISMP